MTDDELEIQLRERLRAADLPAAPTTLRRVLDELPEPPARRRNSRIGGFVLLAAATLTLMGLSIGGLLGGGRLRDNTPSVPPSAAPPTTAIGPTHSAPNAPAGFVPFEAPGIAFAHPGDWGGSTALENFPEVLGTRHVGTFARRMTLCPFTSNTDPAPTEPAGCARQAQEPGTLVVQVNEYMRQLPGAADLSGAPTTYAGYPGSSPRDDVDYGDPAAMYWLVSGPDGGLYIFWAQTPRADVQSLRGEMEATLATLQLSSWQPPPAVINGRIHVDTLQGFSFDYPAGWVIYYPNDTSMMDHGVVVVASRPLEKPCPEDTCQRYTVPEDTVAVEFRIGSGPEEPDWSRAKTTVGGQPAITYHWDQTATGGDEGDQWNVRLDDKRSVLGIYSSLRGPSLKEQQALVEQVIASVQIDAPPP